MTENYFDTIINFFGKFLKFALRIFTGAIIIVGIVWIFFTIFEWLYIGVSWLKDQIINNKPDTNEPNKNRTLIPYVSGSTKCPNCYILVSDKLECHICGTRLNKKSQPTSIKNIYEDAGDVSVVQYSERKKHQRIKCPYCNSQSNVIKETLGAQTRECRNGHIFVYDYESEMLIQDDLNAKYK